MTARFFFSNMRMEETDLFCKFEIGAYGEWLVGNYPLLKCDGLTSGLLTIVNNHRSAEFK